MTISSGLDEKQKEAAEAFTAFLSQPKNMEKWVLMSPGGAQPVNKQVVELDGYKENEVIKSFGELPSEIASAFDEVQVFGLVGEKNFTKMGDITSSGVIGKAVNQVTVGNEDVDQALADAQKIRNNKKFCQWCSKKSDSYWQIIRGGFNESSKETF